MSKKTKRFAIGALIVGAVGYVAGILTAPKSGKETRADISQMRDKGVAEAEKQLKKLHTELNQLLSEVETYVKDSDSRSKTNEAIEGEIIDKANNARQKAREILSALHDGTADDKDLEKAVNDVSGAIKSLKKYLKK
jgi:gas vesicle protein